MSDNQWQQQFNQNKAVADRNYNYQVSRDKVADDQWLKEYQLALKKANSSGSSSRGSSRSSSSGSKTGSYSIPEDSPQNKQTQTVTIDDIVKNLKVVQGPTIGNNIYDSYSGKYFSSPEEVIKYWQNQ